MYDGIQGSSMELKIHGNLVSEICGIPGISMEMKDSAEHMI